jgi:predicted dehydrogenase
VSNQLGVAIIGSGLQAETYAACLARHVKDAHLTTIWGGSHADELTRTWGGRAGASAQDAIGDPDVSLVIVTTPNSAHAEYARQALALGRHVAVERPIAPTAVEAAALRDLAADRELLFTTLQTGRYLAGPRAASAALEAGHLGPVQMLQLWWTGTSYPVDPTNWRADPGEGGLFLDVGEHAFDLLAWLAGSAIARVDARIANFGGTEAAEPSAMVQLEFESGALGQAWITFEVPWPGLPRSACRAVVIAQRGILDVDSYGDSWLRRAARLGRAPAEYLDATDFGHADLGTGSSWQRLAAEEPGDSSAVARDDPRRLGKFAVQLQEIADALAGRRPWPSQGHDGVLAIATVEACRRSAASGLPERVDPRASGTP